MRTYRLFKSSFSLEDYLTEISNQHHRKALTRFRISAHKLQIERGRYTVPFTPANERFCIHCKDKIEDEYHFLMECSLYDDGRNMLFAELIGVCQAFQELHK